MFDMEPLQAVDPTPWEHSVLKPSADAYESSDEGDFLPLLCWAAKRPAPNLMVLGSGSIKSTMTVICLCAFALQIPLDLHYTEETLPASRVKVPKKHVTLLITFVDPSPDFRLRELVVTFRLDGAAPVIQNVDETIQMVSIPFYCV
jgi:hypothetical protein